jgi:hypothetical protein
MTGAKARSDVAGARRIVTNGFAATVGISCASFALGRAAPGAKGGKWQGTIARFGRVPCSRETDQIPALCNRSGKGADGGTGESLVETYVLPWNE